MPENTALFTDRWLGSFEDKGALSSKLYGDDSTCAKEMLLASFETLYRAAVAGSEDALKAAQSVFHTTPVQEALQKDALGLSVELMLWSGVYVSKEAIIACLEVSRQSIAEHDESDWDGETPTIDVRFGVEPSSNTWVFKDGDASFQQSWKGFWGASSLDAETTDEELSEIVQSLFEEVMDHIGMSEE